MRKIFKAVFLILTFLSFTPLYSQSGWTSMSFPNKRYLDINFVENNVGFLFSAGSGTIYKTLNNGVNWFTIEPGLNSISGACFTTEALGCLVGNAIYRTTTGGWGMGVLPNTHDGILQIAAAKYASQDTAFASGVDFYPLPNPCCYDAVIWRTTDGGVTWTENMRYGGSYNTGLFVKDAKNAAVLNPDRIFYTTNGGGNWTVKPYDIFSQVIGWSFTNPYLDTIYIAGRYGGIIRTTNNGNNWTLSATIQQTGPLNKVFMTDSKTAYAVGDTGKIYYTSNAGNTWIRQNSGTTKTLTSVWFINKDSGYVCGDSGVFLRTYTAGLTSVQTVSTEVPNEFALYQNYPNPFNPGTNIKFSILLPSEVVLQVHDINGKEMEKLVSEFLKPGEYEIKWNAEKYPSGIYFYTLRTEKFNITRKMILMK